MPGLRLNWRADWAPSGATYGFNTHAERLRQACEGLGAKTDPNADIAVFVGPPEDFSPIKDKYNVLFTAWEHETIPQYLANPAKEADLIAVPSLYLKPVFEKTTGRPVAVIHLGVDRPPFNPLKLNRAKRRKRPDDVFTWFWCGQADMRKGWDILPEIWKAYTFLGLRRANFPPSRLYIKTSNQDGTPGSLEAAPGDPPFPVIYDSRNLSRLDYWRLMQDADAFLFTSRGEGFGLTLAEALAAALPAVYPPTTAMLDYAVGFPCETEPGWTESPRWGRMDCQVASTASVVEQMIGVASGYRQACQIGRKAARRMRAFTWTAAAMSFLAVVEARLREDRGWR